MECFSPKQINMWFISILCWRNKEYAFSHTYIYFIQKGFLYYCVGEKPYRVTFPLSIICRLRLQYHITVMRLHLTQFIITITKWIKNQGRKNEYSKHHFITSGCYRTTKEVFLPKCVILRKINIKLMYVLFDILYLSDYLKWYKIKIRFLTSKRSNLHCKRLFYHIQCVYIIRSLLYNVFFVFIVIDIVIIVIFVCVSQTCEVWYAITISSSWTIPTI